MKVFSEFSEKFSKFSENEILKLRLESGLSYLGCKIKLCSIVLDDTDYIAVSFSKS